MNNELSGIWKQVSDYFYIKDLSELGFCELSKAAEYVIDSTEEQYSFRRNRELLDIEYRFRYFKFKK